VNVFGVFRAHAGMAYGQPVAAYLAVDAAAAWRMFAAEHKTDQTANYRMVRV